MNAHFQGRTASAQTTRSYRPMARAHLLRWAWVLLLCVLLGPFRAVLAGDAGEIVSVLGSVEVLREGRWQPIQSGEMLAVGAVLKTADGSRVALQLANGSQIKLNANCELELKKIAPREGVAQAANTPMQNILRVFKGEIWVRSNGVPLEIQSMPVVATIRGTEFNLAVGPDQVARLAVLDGVVEFHNPQGSVMVAANEQATAKAGEAPRKTVLLNPLDAVQWSLYYPDLAKDRARREQTSRVDPRSSRHWTEAARGHLLRGQVPEARRALDRALALDPQDARAYSLRAVIELVQNRKAEARAEAERAVAADPESPVAHLGLSWVQQAEFDLDGALASARQAVRLDPDDPQALAQESRLLFGMGRLKQALKAAERARQRAPDDALVNSTWGFLQLARGRTEPAKQAFRQAISQDSTLGEPHLGLGLALFRQNRAEAAVEEMRKATLLEPKVSLYNSYLGKAYFEIKDDRLAKKYFAQAKQLDPRDPTPHFYEAVRLQSVNRPVEAARNLQKSIELNDNRAVYRSRLLLDEDAATREISLARTYIEMGFDKVANVEAAKSLNVDPANHSAHRFLSDSYVTRPRHEIARVSELLQAQLLQPLNINPIQPSLNEISLKINNGFKASTFNEYTSLFERDQTQLLVSGVAGDNKTLANEIVLSGLKGPLSYSLGQFHFETDGFRENADIRHDIYNAFVQIEATQQLTLQTEYRRRKTEHGDIRLRFDDSHDPESRFKAQQDTARLGAHFAASPRSDIIASLIYSERNEKEDDATEKGYQTEVQYLYRADHFNWIAGIGGYQLDSPGNASSATFETQQLNAYNYLHFTTLDNLLWTLGFSYNSLDQSQGQPLQVDALNPKLGLQWRATANSQLRIAAFKTLKPRLVVQETIEPSQVAGFNQFFDEPNATQAKNYGLAWDIQIANNLYAGVEALHRKLDLLFFNAYFSEFDFFDGQEKFYSGYLYWAPHPRWTVRGEYRFENTLVDGLSRLPPESELSPEAGKTSYHLKTISIPFSVHYFSSSGLFGKFGATYVHQEVDKKGFVFNKRPFSDDDFIGKDDFVLLDATVGYQLPNRWGLVSLEARNLLDTKFHYEELPDTLAITESEDYRYSPERQVFARFKLHF